MEKFITIYEVLDEKEIQIEHLDEINRLISEAYKNKTGSFSTKLVEKKIGLNSMLVKAYPTSFQPEISQICQQYLKLIQLTTPKKY